MTVLHFVIGGYQNINQKGKFQMSDQIEKHLQLIDELVEDLKKDDSYKAKRTIAELLKAEASLVTASFSSVGMSMFEKYRGLIEKELDSDLDKD